MSRTIKTISLLAVFGLLALTVVSPVRAFDSRSGETIVIEKDEVVEDDLYLNASTIVVNGTIKGDLVAFGQSITVNGVVEGDLMAAGQTVVVTGEVMDDVRIAGAALQLAAGGVIGDDLIAAGASLETQPASQVGGDLVVGSAQALLAGDVAGDVTAGTAALELRGSFGGNVQAYVDVTEETESMPPMNMYMTDIPISIPNVPPGLTVAEEAEIAGDLEYSSTIDLPIPARAIRGHVNRILPEITQEMVEVQPTDAQRVGTWALDMLRLAVTLILLGLFLGWLFPHFTKALPENLRAKPLASLGWGLVSWAAFIFGLLVILMAMILGGLLFGAFTLGSLTGTVIWIGILALFALVLGFVLAASYLAKIVVGEALGKWLFKGLSPNLADHKFWPMILGVILLVLVIGMVSFPLLPFELGGLTKFVVGLFGLGALWIWGGSRLAKKPEANIQ